MLSQGEGMRQMLSATCTSVRRMAAGPATVALLLTFLSCVSLPAIAQTPRRGIENPAALSSFFKALDDMKNGRRIEPVRVAHYGDSHTAADILTADIRRQFQRDFGDGGPGYMIARNPFSTPRRGVISGATTGWSI